MGWNWRRYIDNKFQAVKLSKAIHRFQHWKEETVQNRFWERPIQVDEQRGLWQNHGRCQETYGVCVNSLTYKARHIINENLVGVETEKAVAGCQGGPWGIRASDLRAPSLNCLVVRSLDPLKIQNPTFKIQNPESKIQSSVQNRSFFGPVLGIWDFGFWTVM